MPRAASLLRAPGNVRSTLHGRELLETVQPERERQAAADHQRSNEVSGHRLDLAPVLRQHPPPVKDTDQKRAQRLTSGPVRAALSGAASKISPPLHTLRPRIEIIKLPKHN